MSDKSNKYGYVGVDIPAQSFGANKGVFNPAEINELYHNRKWSTVGNMELIGTYSATNLGAGSALEIPDIQSDKYDVHFVTVSDFRAVSASSSGTLHFISGGTKITTGTYAISYANMDNSYLTLTESYSTTTTTPGITFPYDPAVSRNSMFWIYDAGSSDRYTFVDFISPTMNNGRNNLHFGTGVWYGGYHVDGFAITIGSAASDIGAVSVYGMRSF